MTLGRRGQLAWSWTFISVSLGLLAATFYFIVTQEITDTSKTPLLAAGANEARLNIFGSFFDYIPIVMLISWGVFLIIMASLTRGGDTYGG